MGQSLYYAPHFDYWNMLNEKHIVLAAWFFKIALPAAALLLLSIGAAVGVYTYIYVSENRTAFIQIHNCSKMTLTGLTH
jgi:hypothetical protein